MGFLRLICRKGFAAAGSSDKISWNRTAAAGCGNWFHYGGRRQMSTLKNPRDSLRAKHFVEEVEHLVVVEDHLLRVNQYVMDAVAPDGSFCYHIDQRSQNCPHMTLDFTVHKYDPEKGDFEHVDRWSLGGLALFVGCQNQSVAFHAASDQYPELKPNSIYFTEPYGIGSLTGLCDDFLPFGGHDIGIFNYEDKTVSSCYYPCDVQSLKKIFPAPMWFFPSRFI